MKRWARSSWSRPANPDNSAPAGVLSLALDTAARVGARFEAPLRNVMAAIHALPVTARLNAGERGEHPLALPAGRTQYRLRPVAFGQVRTSVGQIRGCPDKRLRALQDRNRPVKLVAHSLKARAGDA
jgi:hypothetical protein